MSESESGPIRITHFSDMLCVWAYASQIRMDELSNEFGRDIEIDYHFCEVFGDVPGKMASQWAERGGIQGYGQHVQDIVDGFEHLEVHPDIWVRQAPASSIPPHIFLCGVRLLAAQSPDIGGSVFERTTRAVREAFFTELADISQRSVLLEIAAGCGLPVPVLIEVLDSGRAHAAYAANLELARTLGIRVSPTLIFNEGRQLLKGNVGYRVIEANVRELLDRPADQLSWC